MDIHTTLRHGAPAWYGPYAADVGTVVGFDLDMTLVDSHTAITSSLDHVCRSHAVERGHEELAAKIGLPLDDVLVSLVPGIDPVVGARIYREYYERTALASTTILAGAHSALALVSGTGGTTVVVTAKREDQARMVLAHVGLSADRVVGGTFGHEKGDALREVGAHAYVGDHPGDMVGASRAEALAIGVLTGGHTSDQLLAAGADIILSTLEAFEPWYSEWQRG